MIGGSHVTQLQGPIKLNLLAEAVHEGEGSENLALPPDIGECYLRVKLEEFVAHASALRNVWPPEARNTAAVQHAECMIDLLREQLHFPPPLDIPGNLRLIRSDAA